MYVRKDNTMCVRCEDGWAEHRINGDLLSGGFCDCPEGHNLNAEMGEMWDELDHPIDEEGELHKDGHWSFFDAMQERF